MAIPLRILSVIGARPQIIKAAAVSRAVASRGDRIVHTILHTGQHYDAGMSEVFFQELGIPPADINLGVGSGSHGRQTARMMEAIEEVLLRKEHDVVVLYGDTNSTLAGALAAIKLRVPVAHIEAGLRSFNKAMPEEINRIVCDQCSSWLFCPTSTAVSNLAKEGYPEPVNGTATPERPVVDLSGDVMFDNSRYFGGLATQRSTILREQSLEPNAFILATIHRDHNTDDPEKLTAILTALLDASERHAITTLLPLHPRTSRSIESILPSSVRDRIAKSTLLRIIAPVGFLDMIQLERNARMVLTDSGGVQKEAFFFGKPCVILREETEWVELVEHGQAILTGADPHRIGSAVDHFFHHDLPVCPELFGNGHAAERICDVLLATTR